MPTDVQRDRPLRARLALAVLLLAVLLQQTPTALAAAGAAPPAPGELTLRDKAGRETGVCPLKHTDVQADVAGYVARVTVTQEFQNTSRTPVEAVYTFPLPADAAVDDMTMTIGARVVQGEIKRRDEARRIYEDAKSQGQAAALLDQERPNVFTQNVANMMPGAPVKITITYVHLLKYDDGRYEWSFPMVVGPRYIGAGVADAAKISPPITPPGTRAGHDISVRVHVDAGLPLTGLTSVLHPISVKRIGATAADVTLAGGNEIPNKDFVLRWTAAGSQMQSGMLTYAPGPATGAITGGRTGGYFTLILQPPLAPARGQISPKEMVFVIDQTGSQMGWPIEKAKETMRHCIQRLNPGDTFQLLGFNTDVYPCFPKPVPATPANIKTALDYLAPLAGAGGTDILKAADYALKMPDDPKRLRIVCFMTDGYVGDDMQILDYVKKHRGRARMFPFGVGNGVNRFLIDGMAREGRGAAEYVTLDEDGQEAADRFYKRIADPILLSPQVDWHGLPVEEVYPQQIPDVFSQGPIILKGRYAGAAQGDVTVSGYLHGQPWSQTIHVVFPATHADGSAIATLWARDRIEDLQSQDWIGAQTGHPDTTIQPQIVQTALDYRLMSQWTSFVAVEQRVVNIGGRQRTVDVPVEMPEGVSYDGVSGQFTDKNGSSTLILGSAVRRGGYGGGGFAAGNAAGGTVIVAPSQQVFAAAPIASPLPAAIPQMSQTQQMTKSQPNSAYAAKSDSATDADSALGLETDKDIRDGTPAGQKRLEALPAVDRRTLLEQVKLAPALQPFAQGKAAGPDGPTVTQGRVDVQLWLNALPADGLAKLKALGFTLSATLTPGKLYLGTVPVTGLDALLELSWVRRVEPPQFR